MSASSLVLVRHAATTWSEDGRLQGLHDLPLSTSGLEELPDLVVDLRRVVRAPLVVLRSPLLRALQTAEAIADGLGSAVLSVRTLPALREVDFGHFQGARADALVQGTPVAKAFARVDLDWQWPGGDQLRERAKAADLAIRQEVAGAAQTVLVVTHGMLIQGLVAFWQGKRFGDDFDLPVGTFVLLDVEMSDTGPCFLNPTVFP